MAGDWIKLQYWRSKCPEIVRVSSATQRTRHEVLGLLCDFWSWISTESSTGRVGVFMSDLPGIVGADPAFWAAVQSVGWLDEDELGIVVPGWEIWLSESAKKRATDAVRKRIDRKNPCPNSVREMSVNSRTKFGPEKRREEKSINTPLTPHSGGGSTDRSPTLFDRFWAAYPRKIAKPRALAAWKKIKPDDDLLAKMLAAIEWQRTSDQWTRDGGQFIPHPATWLNARRWEDERPAPGSRAPTRLDPVTQYARDTILHAAGLEE